MATNKSAKVVAAITSGLLLASVFWLIGATHKYSSLDKDLAKESLRSESLLSEKLLKEKELQKVNRQVSDLKDELRQLQDRYASAVSTLENQQADYNRMKRSNASLDQLRNERADLIVIQNQLRNEIQSLIEDKTALQSKSEDLESTVALLQERNKLLTDDLKRAMLAEVGQPMVNAVKGKSEKLTVKAGRTGKLIATFDLPAEYKNLSFRILDSNGNILSNEEGVFSSTTTPSKDSYTASSDLISEQHKLQTVQMVFTTSKKLKAGVYSVEILNENLYIGSLRVNLK